MGPAIFHNLDRHIVSLRLPPGSLPRSCADSVPTSVHLPVDNANLDGGKLLGTKSTPFGSAATGIRGPERLDALETCLIREKLPMLMPAAVTGSPVWGIVPIEVMLFTTRR